MNDSSWLIQALKKTLKTKGLTYADLAKRLQLSETTIKRMFSEQNFTLKRLEDVCAAIDSSLFQILQIAEHEQNANTYTYTEEQERFFSKYPKVLAYFDLLLTGNSVESIEKKHQLSKRLSFKYLRDLEKLGLIELLPNNRFQFKTSKNIMWIRDGVLAQTLYKKAETEFLDSDFNGDGELRKILMLKLTPASAQKIIQMAKELAEKAFERDTSEQILNSTETRPTGVFVAIRPWAFSALNQVK